MGILDEYLAVTDETAVYPDAGDGTVEAVTYAALGLSGEVGEVANQVKKILRDDEFVITTERADKIYDELGDVLWYWMRLCREMNFDPETVIRKNVEKLATRSALGNLKGDRRGD